MIVVQNRIELNDYVSRAEAFREAQLEAMSIAAYCASIAVSAEQAIISCDASAQNGVDTSYVMENYSLNSNVLCGEAGWLYVRSEIKFFITD